MKRTSAIIMILVFLIPLLTNVHFCKADDDYVYVDDDNTTGPWDGTQEYPYQLIQDGITYAKRGQTIFVFEGSYFENIIIGKTIYLKGENKSSVIINGGGEGNVIEIFEDDVSVSDFTIINSGKKDFWNSDTKYGGIKIKADSADIQNNIIIDNKGCGVVIESSGHNFIFNNIISNNDEHGIYGYYQQSTLNIQNNNITKNKKNGIEISGTKCNIIFNNISENNNEGIFISGDYNAIISNDIIDNFHDGISCYGRSCEIKNNVISDNGNGGILSSGYNNIISNNYIIDNFNEGIICYGNGCFISYNHIENNWGGINVFSDYLGSAHQIKNNNIISCYPAAKFRNNKYSLLFFLEGNIWGENYWNQNRNFPKIIFGQVKISIDSNYFYWFEIDKNPASQPYSIEFNY